MGFAVSGVYSMYLGGSTPFDAFCNMTDGGWTVFQKRVDNSVDFYRGWKDYVAGFGDLEGNMWLGLDRLHVLTSQSDTKLRVYMDTFEGDIAIAEYAHFAVGDATSGYELSVSGYSGTAGDSLSIHNGRRFSTYDKDSSAIVVTVKFHGAWWYVSAGHKSNLNGRYLAGHHSSYADGMDWLSFKGYYYSVKTTIMMLSRK